MPTNLSLGQPQILRTREEVRMDIHWTPPIQFWAKINSDGSRVAGCGVNY